MKKVLAIALLVLLCSGMALASEANWALYIKTDDGALGSPGPTSQVFGAKAAQDAWDSLDGAEYPWGGTSQAKLALFDLAVGEVHKAYSKSYMSAALPQTYPVNTKKWDLMVGTQPNPNNGLLPIRLQIGTATATVAAPQTIGGQAVQYKLVMVNNRLVPGAPVNGTEWIMTVPTTISTWFFSVSLPNVMMTANTSQGMLDGGYKMQLQQINPVPEPSSLLALGAGIMGLVGFATKRRRA